MPNKFLERLENFGESLKDTAEGVLEQIDDKIEIDFVAIKKAGDLCYTKARETSGLCSITTAKAREMVAFGRELHATLDDVSSSRLDASKFATIQDLVDGDKIREATQLARDLSDLSLQCVDTSQDMMVAIESGIDALPDAIEPFVEKKLLKAQTKGARPGDPKLPDVAGSVRELQSLVEDVETVDLFTIVDRGSRAFGSLRTNGELSRDMFSSIGTFAKDVETVSGSFRAFKEEDHLGRVQMLGRIRKIAKSAWRCLRLSSLIREFAERVGELIRWMISLFQTASARLGSIWGALANARTVLAACLGSVLESIRLCEDSRGKSKLLLSTVKEIRDHLKNATRLGNPGKALASLADLADGDEIARCLALGTSLDDIFVACIQHVIGTIRKVDAAIRDMPDVLKKGVPTQAQLPSTVASGSGSTTEENDDDGDIEFEDYDYATGQTTPIATTARDLPMAGDSEAAAPLSRRVTAQTHKVSVRKNVRSLEALTNKIESASALTVLSRSAAGLEGSCEALQDCAGLMADSQNFAGDCRTAIESFNHGEWDLAAAGQHILEVFAVHDAGMALKALAESILELLQANLALIRAVRAKTRGLASSGGSDGSKLGLGSLVSSLASDVDADDLKQLGNGLKQFGKLFQ